MASWKKIIVSGSSPEFNALTVDNGITGGTLTLDSLSAQNSEATSLMINGSGVVGTRELGSNAFNSTTIAVTGYNNTGDNRIITSLGGSSINGEANLTFDGSLLDVTGNVDVSGILDVTTGISSSGYIYAPSIGTGTDNSVVILDSDGKLKTDEIDSRVWGSTLVDGSGTAGHISYWSDGNTITGESNLFWDETNNRLGIGTSSPSDSVHISNGRLRVSDTVLNNGTTNLTFEPEAPTHGQTYTVNVIAEDVGKALFGDVTANIYIPYFGNQTADIVLTQGDQIISGSKTFADNVLIAGNLIKKGTEAGAGETAIQFTTNSTTGDGEIAFETSGSEVLRIDKSGNIGIGVATPLNALDVSGSVSASGTMFSLTVDTTEVSSSVVSSSLYLGTDFGNPDGSSNFTGSFTGDGSGLTGIASTLTFSDESDTSSTVALTTQTFKITGGEGINTSASGQILTISGEDATTTNKGIASFNTTNFSVSSGAVSSKNFTITSGNGLTGGGALTLGGSTTLNVVSANNGIVVNSDNIQLATASSTFTDGVKSKLNSDGVISSSIQVDHDATTNFVANEHIDHSTVSITAGNGLSGGGDLTATRTLALDFSELTDKTSDITGTTEFILQDGTTESRKAASEIKLSVFNNDAGWTSNVGDITGVTAGNGLTGGGSTGTVTLNVGAGTGIDVAADAISVDVSDFMTNGVNNRLLTATGADAMNAEANLTFDGSLLTVTGNTIVTGDLTVQGTTTTLDTQNVLVEDRFIFLNHGSGSISPTSEGGIVVEGTTPDQGNAFYYDGNSARWSVGESVAQDASSVTANAFAAAVVDVDGGQSDTATYQKNGNIKVESGEIWIYA